MARGLPGRIEANTLKMLSEGGSLNFTEAGVHRNWKVRGGFRGEGPAGCLFMAAVLGTELKVAFILWGGRQHRALFIHSFRQHTLSFH